MKPMNYAAKLTSMFGLAGLIALGVGLSADSKVLYGHLEERMAAPPPAAQPSDSIPEELEGTWQCVTTVTHSFVDTVPVGQKVVSRIDFVKDSAGRVNAAWQQPGWVDAQSQISNWGTRFVIDRSSYFLQGGNPAWAARSRDRYDVLDADRLVSNSDVDQYLHGHYIGRYRTRSVLHRVTPDIAWQTR